MLLNASHKLTSSGLPPDLLDAYVRYKRSTRGLLTWFQQRSSTPDKPIKSLTIKGLESLAQQVSEKLESLPDIVHFYFREAIADRNRLSKHYRTEVDDTADDDDTVGHEHFTTLLEKIYGDLCARYGGPKSQKNEKRRSQSPTSQSPQPVNQYEGLMVEEAKDHEGHDNRDAEMLTHCTAPTAVPCHTTRRDTNIHLADDELGNALERIQDISTSIDGYWAAAGKGMISFVVASFMTNAALAALRQVANELLQHDENLSISEFLRVCSSFRSSFEAELRNQKIIGTNTSLLSRLQHIERNLSNCRKDDDLFSHDPSCARCGHNFASQVHSIVFKGAGGSRFISSAMIENIVHLVSGEIIPHNAILRSTPVYSDVAADLVTDTNNHKQSWAAVLGLNLLTQSYRVYLHHVKQPNLVPKSRITALKLAQQVCSQVTTLLQDQTCFPCRCSQTLGWHLQSMALDLQCYARHNCWDLVFQSPWVAGNHVLEILDLCNYYGHYLLKYRHYVGAIVHSYNALTNLGGLDNLPLLEKIGSQYRETLFPGGNLPKSNFHACWARYVGARLKFRKNHKGKNTHDNWCLAIPAHAAKMAAGIGIPDHRQRDRVGCLLFNIKQQEYHISDAQWDELNDSYAKVQSMRKNKSQEISAMKMPTSSAQMEKQRLLPLAMTTQGLFAGSGKTLPKARVNLFAVFERCVQVVSTISDKMHQEEHLGKGDYCICFANELLNAADRIVKGRRFGKLAAWKEHERKLVNDTKDAILAAFGNVKEEELLWDV
ncbi:hypothetical protein G647_00931 [Cladophialophora carrionii CBS 160.54]|uniref:DUF6604 domain-containing protein n=1 Tax=Cladophialophora carrionii CBS 160.54 TaxID=1279043 RepID=V9DRB0_9EURO|nr:uncharacterized protein G647_00931 [Cladophialophora carrionii CBS 160.54]ETI28482.1 hypothetical protein G647_00931 [Cladophialophora carrionii CBS 160.54]